MSTSDTKDFDPSRYATLRLFSHINLKGTQVGGLLGCGLVLPFLAFRGYRQGKPLDIQSASKALAYSTGVGLLLSDGLGLALYARMDQEGLEDRVYRLHFNASQSRCDLFSTTCGILSAAAASLLLNRSLVTLIGGFTVGSAIGTVGHVLTSKEQPSNVEKMVHELETPPAA